MPFDPEKGIHVFNSHSQLFLKVDGPNAAVYDISPGQTLRQFQEKKLLAVTPELQDHPIMDRPTKGMSVGFNTTEKLFFTPTSSDDSLERHIKALDQSFHNRAGRLGLTEVTGGMILGAPETAAVLLMHLEKTQHHLPLNCSRHRWILVDLFAEVPYEGGVARMGWKDNKKLTLAPYADSKKKEPTATALFILPASARTRLT